MKYLITFLISGLVWAEMSPEQKGKSQETKTYLQSETETRHALEQDSSHQERGPKGRQAQEAVKKGELEVTKEEQKRKQKGE